MTKPKGPGTICPPPPASPQESGATAFVVQQAPNPPEEKLSAWVPLFQSALWAILLAAVLIAFRKEVADLINRIKSMDVGPVKFETEPESTEPLSTAIPETMVIEEIRFE